MRVAFVSTIFHYPWGGPDKRWTAMAEAVRARGDEVLLAIAPRTADHPRIRKLQEAGAKLWLRPRPSAFLGRIDGWRRHVPGFRGPYLETQLAAFQPDAVFILQGGSYDVLLEYHLIEWLVARRIPYVLSCSLNRPMDPLESRSMQIIGRAFDHAAAVLFMSSDNRRLAQEFLGRPLAHANLVQNPLDVNFTPAEAAPAIEDRRPRLGFIGRVDIDHKGLDLLLEAMGRVRPDHDVNLDLTGRCEDPAALAALAERHGVGDRVTCRGPAEGEALRRAYEAAEIVVLPSRWEGCASTMLEAMMAGRVQLVTPVGGVADWLTDGVDAFVATGVGVDAVERALRRALSERERWPEMGRAARAAFESRRDPDPLGTLMGHLDRAATRGRLANG